MNRLKKLFEKPSEKKDILNVYFTAGYPSLDRTLPIIKSLEDAGVDIVELGIPFSDPLADGPTIQKSSERALENGMTIEVLFEQLKNLRKESNVPIILMGYLNPIMQFGLDRFLEQAKKIGVDGFIFPDVPTQEFEREWKNKLEEMDLTFTFLVTPQTSEERVRHLDKLSSGFLYAVSSSSTTGSEKKENEDEKIRSYLGRLKSYNLENPVLAGFGISTKADYDRVNECADGAIIGSAFIKHLAKNGASDESINSFVSSIKSVDH